MSDPAGRRFFFELPLLRRELVALLRTRRAFWLLVCTVLLSCLLPLLSWPSHRREAGLFWEENLIILNIFFLTQLSAAILIIPAFTAGAIAGEREQNTYQLLYSTQLSPSSIIFSKTLASAGYVLILLLASAPAVCILYLLGGVEFGAILRCYAVTIAAVMTSGLVCLGQSMRSRRVSHAAVRGIIWVLVWNGGLMLLILLAGALLNLLLDLDVLGHDFGELLIFILLGFSPFPGIFYEILRGSPGMVPPLPFAPWFRPWLVFLLYAGVISAVQIILLLIRVRTPDLAVSRRRERRRAIKGKPMRPVRRCLLARVLILLGDEGAPLLKNPVFLKELRSEFFSRPWYRRLVFWLSLAIFTAIALLDANDPEIVMGVGMTALVLLSLISPGIAASAIPREVEQGNLDFLRGTLLSLRQVLSGKFLASIYGTLGIAAAAGWVMLGLLLYNSTVSQWQYSRYSGGYILKIPACFIILLVTLIFTTAVSIFASVISRRTLGALLISYGMLLALLLGWPVAVALAGTHGDMELTLLGATSPFAAIAILCETPRDIQPAVFIVFLALFGGATFLLWMTSAVLLENLRGRDR